MARTKSCLTFLKDEELFDLLFFVRPDFDIHAIALPYIIHAAGATRVFNISSILAPNILTWTNPKDFRL